MCVCVCVYIYCVCLGREEHITEAVMFWNQRKLRRLPFLLQTRLQEVKTIAYVAMYIIFGMHMYIGTKKVN